MLSTILLIALIFAFSPNQVGLNSEAALRNQVERYHSYFSNGRYDLMWEMLSKNAREKNDNDKKGYIRRLRKYGFGKVKAEINKIDVEGTRARVRVEMTVWSKPDKKWVSEVDDETWVLEKGRWVFEDHQAAESASSGEGA
ncbi:MAG: hypothetical protein ACREBG_14255 [Pyrinomonadaceae bacterium]